MTESDKAIRELMEVKFNHVDEKIDLILQNQLDTNKRLEEIAKKQATTDSETSVWRWFQRKPKRFGIVAIVIIALSIPEVKEMIFKFFKFM